MRIGIAGGTGTLGRYVVHRVLPDGHAQPDRRRTTRGRVAPSRLVDRRHRPSQFGLLQGKARGGHRLMVPMRLPGAVGRAMTGGGLLPTDEGPRGTQTFEEWLVTDGSRDASRSTERR